MDDKDRKLIEMLKSDGRASYVLLGQELGLSEAAVRRRVKALVDKGAIKRFTVEIREEDKAKALTLISVNPSATTSQVAEKLIRIPNVDKIYEITGEYDIVALISASNIVEANACIDDIRKSDGVTNTNTIIILKEI